MHQPKIELQIPLEIYKRASQIAHDSNRSIESVLLDGLALLFGALPESGISPDELSAYTEEQLWAIVHQRLAWPQDTRLRELIALGKQGQLTEDEKLEIERLIDVTARCRATIARLRMNRDAVVNARRRWVEAGWHPPTDET